MDSPLTIPITPKPPSFSITPGASGSGAGGKLTWQDVVMRIVGDLPLYAVIAVAGDLALKQRANFQEFLIAVLAALGFKSWPRPVGNISMGVLGAVLIWFWVTRAYAAH